jgi:hypothetical protein
MRAWVPGDHHFSFDNLSLAIDLADDFGLFHPIFAFEALAMLMHREAVLAKLYEDLIGLKGTSGVNDSYEHT